MNPLLTFLLLAMGCPTAPEKTDDTGRDTSLPDTDAPDTDTDVGACDGALEATTWCADPAADGTCEPPTAYTLPHDACDIIVCSIDGPGTIREQTDTGGTHDVCCYPVTANTHTDCVEGRPLTVNGVARLADALPRDGWGAAGDAGALPLPVRRKLAYAWSRAALAEHASIAAFARLSLDLLSLGAPADLVLDAQRAGADEVRHAKDAFALAATFGGDAMGPGPLDLTGVRLGADLATLARETVIEGCIGETISAALAEAALAVATDPAVRRVLARIVADERRHAALAWRIVQWAVATGGTDVQDAVADGFRTVPRVLADEDGLAAWGRLGAAQVRDVTMRTLREVVGPASERLAA